MVNRILYLIGKNEETTMRLESAFLCDCVDFTEKGLLNAYGMGIHALSFSKLPDKRPIMLVIAIEYDSVKDSGTHTIGIRIIDSDGRGVIKPIKMDDKFPTTARYYALDTKLYPTFDKYETHSVEVTLDGNNIASLPLDVVQESLK